jgi:hypothetical protein
MTLYSGKQEFFSVLIVWCYRSNHPVSSENPPKEPQEEVSQDTAGTRQASSSAASGSHNKCRVQIYSLRSHQVVKTLDHLDNEESAEITGIQSNDRVIALVTKIPLSVNCL